ncbi:MAG: Holliday junction branch migration protein RuvA [Deltaproteobacteria bacterium]|nr:Holliday junction branch migration protein RuvA [Deltaproteobacteria bacterium]
MIGRLHGLVVAESADGSAVVDVGGVGYEVWVPLGSLGRAPRESDGRVTLLIHTSVREDAITLYGFADAFERDVYRYLTSVTGVGPRIAIGILGALAPVELASAITRGDIKRLQTAPGVGKKLAERLVLELKDKLGSAVPSGTSAVSLGAHAGAPALGRAGPTGLLVDALTKMGFKPMEAERAALELRDRATEPLDVLMRDALRLLTS